jgi:CubicO group peptidase (beta-lactamase class C family)
MLLRPVPQILTVATLSLLLTTGVAAEPLTREAIAQGIQAGEVEASPLFQSDAQRRVVFAETAYFAPTRAVPAGPSTYALLATPTDLGDVTYEVGGETFSVDSFLQRQPLMGLIVVKDNKILLEHYAPDHGPDRLWITFSVTKSVNSMLIGAAIQDGYIRSLEDRVAD